MSNPLIDRAKKLTKMTKEQKQMVHDAYVLWKKLDNIVTYLEKHKDNLSAIGVEFDLRYVPFRNHEVMSVKLQRSEEDDNGYTSDGRETGAAERPDSTSEGEVEADAAERPDSTSEGDAGAGREDVPADARGEE